MYINHTQSKPMTTLGELLRSSLDKDYDMNRKEINLITKINSHISGKTAIMSRKYIVGSLDAHGNMSISPNPTTHLSDSLARQEAQRLARISPGKMYVLMQLAGGEMLPAAPAITSI